jgi:hypothetical protein
MRGNETRSVELRAVVWIAVRLSLEVAVQQRMRNRPDDIHAAREETA